MAIEKTPAGVIAVFVEGLENTPGWVVLDRKKQDALLEHTSHIQQNRQLQMLGEFGELMELYQVQKLLEGEAMKMKDYIMRLYPARTIRTVERKREIFNQFVEKIPAPVMKRITAISADTLSRFDRIANAALGDIKNAVKELPALTANTDKAAEQYLEQLDSKLQEHRQARRKKKPLQQNEEHAAKMATNAVLHYMRGCPTLKTSNQKSKFLTRVMGWVMEAQAVSGTLRAGRISIPAGVLIVRGRPRKYPKKEAS